jgi:hypothetical protein
MAADSRHQAVPDRSIEWVLGVRSRRWAFTAYSWFTLVLTSGFVLTILLSSFVLIHETVVLGLGFLFAAVGVLAIQFIVLILVRRSPGFFDIGVSPRGLSIRFPLRTQTFPWSDLVWYTDRMSVQGRSGWRGPPLVALTPAQFQRIQRWFHPS